MAEPSQQADPVPPADTKPVYSLWRLTLYALKLGTTGFGGPVALVGYMYRDLVEQRKWIPEADYKVGLALAQLAPGPLAAQLAMYLGYVHYGILGATIVGIAFALPSFLMVLGISVAYVGFGGLPWMQAVFYGVGSSIIGIISLNAYNLTRRTVRSDVLLWAVFLVVGAVTAITQSENLYLIIGAGVLYWAVKTKPDIPGWWRRRRSAAHPNHMGVALAPIVMALATIPAANLGTLWEIAVFFTKAGAFVFGSGLAIVPFLYGGTVTEHHWLNDRQFLDAVAVALITPGPVVITTAFIGFLIAGFPGSFVAAFCTFLPAYILVILPAKYFKKYGQRPWITAFVQGITVAAIGAIAGAVIVLARRSITDIPTIAIAVVTVVVLWRWKRVPEPAIVLVAAAIGLGVYPLSH